MLKKEAIFLHIFLSISFNLFATVEQASPAGPLGLQVDKLTVGQKNWFSKVRFYWHCYTNPSDCTPEEYEAARVFFVGWPGAWIKSVRKKWHCYNNPSKCTHEEYEVAKKWVSRKKRNVLLAILFVAGISLSYTWYVKKREKWQKEIDKQKLRQGWLLQRKKEREWEKEDKKNRLIQLKAKLEGPIDDNEVKTDFLRHLAWGRYDFAAVYIEKGIEIPLKNPKGFKYNFFESLFYDKTSRYNEKKVVGILKLLATKRNFDFSSYFKEPHYKMLVYQKSSPAIIEAMLTEATINNLSKKTVNDFFDNYYIKERLNKSDLASIKKNIIDRIEAVKKSNVLPFLKNELGMDVTKEIAEYLGISKDSDYWLKSQKKEDDS